VADSRADPAELERLGLYDPDDEHAAERLELIEYLLSLGATIQDILEAGNDLPVVASMVAMRPGRERLTLSEAAARAGVPVQTARRIWRASGLPEPEPDARACTEADVEVLRTFLAGQELFGEAVAIQMARVVGSAVARVADATVSAFVVNVAAPSLAEDPAGLALARANADAATLLPGLSQALDTMLRHHFEASRRPVDAGSGLLRGYDSQELAVGFVDLVDSTRLAQQLSTTELGDALGEFDARAADTIVAKGGRLVKLIGDEVMFVVADADAACAIALELADSLAADDVLPSVRGGIAAGEVLTRDGDYFGPVVNLAARAVKLADPDAVLASAPLAHAASSYRFAPVGAQQLKGFDEPVELFRLERAG
jgi:adenylate cyclase